MLKTSWCLTLWTSFFFTKYFKDQLFIMKFKVFHYYYFLILIKIYNLEQCVCNIKNECTPTNKIMDFRLHYTRICNYKKNINDLAMKPDLLNMNSIDPPSYPDRYPIQSLIHYNHIYQRFYKNISKNSITRLQRNNKFIYIKSKFVLFGYMNAYLYYLYVIIPPTILSSVHNNVFYNNY